MSEKSLLRKLGEETLYSAKGHFKSADLRRIQTKWTIVICMILNVLGIMGVSTNVDKWLSAFGLLGTFFLFYWDAEEGKDYRSRHKTSGESYLSLHKEIRDCYVLKKGDSKELVEHLGKKVRELDGSQRPEISYVARKWAQLAIQKNNETDNWFSKDNK